MLLSLFFVVWFVCLFVLEDCYFVLCFEGREVRVEGFFVTSYVIFRILSHMQQKEPL